MIKLLRGELSAWERDNPIVPDGQPIAVEQSNGFYKLKIGNGTANFNDLPYDSDGADVDLSDYLPLSGGTMTGQINMGGRKITSLGTPTLTTDATTKAYVDGQIDDCLQLSGGTMTGILNAGNHRISGVSTPTATTDAANKQYVDQAVEKVSSTGNYLPLAGGTMAGNINMGTHSITFGDITISYNNAQHRLEFATN